jgi:hypothetical protein
VHLFRPSLSFLAEAQPRTRHFLAKVHIKFLIFEEITNNLLNKFINTY